VSTIGTTADLKQRVQGHVIEPGDASYDSARHVYNAMVDRRPAAIVRCASADDVVAAIEFARTLQLPVAIRGGGHSGPGFGTCDNGIVVDLSDMKHVDVDPDARTIRAQGGCTWGDVDRAGHPHGLTVPCGIISTTGVGGLTLGGGTGYLTRTFGLSIDNLLAATVVLADGRTVNASATENADLFWGLRGGGGNFGVVTSFLFRGQPVRTVIGGPMLWLLDETVPVLQFYRDEMRTMPDDVYGFFATLTIPPGPPFPEALHLKKACGIVWASTASAADTALRLERFRAFREPAVDLVGELPMPALNSMFDALFVPGLQWYWKGDFFTDLSDDAIALHARHSADLPSMLSTMHLYPVDGAASRVPSDATAWGHRHARFSEVIVGVDPDPALAPRLTQWTRDYWAALHSHSTGGAYVNFMGGDEGNDRVRSTYRDNYDRLASVKAKYDPENLFRLNQNIPPQ
jgi:FAD/FMN-containing dehydrogenase